MGEWRQLDQLGRGTFGKVTLYINTNTHQQLALKIVEIDEGSRGWSRTVERWSKEVEIMSRLCHPNIVQTLPLPQELKAISPLPVLCMEYCQRADLRKMLNEAEQCCGLKEPLVRQLLSDVSAALEYLHNERITHRDIKPENIVIKERDNQLTFKLIDLGYAKEWTEKSLSAPGSLVGTLHYIAPEVYTHDYSCSVDYWSLGLVCHEVITGIRPFMPNAPPHLWMEQVKKKSWNEICIYQNEDGSIEYKQELSAESHICQSFRCLLEDWLRIALEWDGNKRGKSSGKLVIFSYLRLILSKKIVTVFSTVTVERLSYEIDGSTAVTTLQEWIRRDTNLPVENQLLLLPSGEGVSPHSLASALFDPQSQVAMVYLLESQGLRLHQKDPEIPPLVRDMLRSPRTPHRYFYLRRIWAQSVFFIQREVFYCDAIMESYAVVLLSLLLLNQEVMALDRSASNELQTTTAFLKMYKEAVAYDTKCWTSIEPHAGAAGASRWKERDDQHSKEVEKLRVIGEKLGSRISSLTSTLSKLQLFLDNFQNPIDRLKKLLDMAYVVYKDLQRKPKEMKEGKAELVDLSMFKIIQNVIKERELFFADKQFSDHLIEVKKCEQEMLSLLEPLRSYEQHIVMVSRAVRKSQLEKQKSIWELVARGIHSTENTQ